MSNGGYKGASPARETSPEQYPGVWELTEQFQAQADGNWPFQAADCAPKSLRFDSGSESNLTKTFATAGNRRVFTWNFWVKLATLSENNIAVVGGGSPNSIRFNADGTFQIKACGGSLTTSAVFRDFSAWYGITVAVDSTAPVASDRIKLFINGEDFTSDLTGTSATLNGEANWNTAATHYIGKQEHNNSNMLDGLLSEVTFIDGQALSCEEFGFFDGQGIWQPKRFTGDYSSGPVYSNFLTGGIDSNYPAPNGFDGVTSGVGVRTSANGTMVWQPTSPIGFNNSFKIYCSLDGTSWGNTFTVTHAGGTTDFTSSVATGTTNTAVDLALISGVTSPITKITVTSGGSNPRFSAIEQDGQILTDASVGRNSFHLEFEASADRSAKDTSGLGNDWAANNVHIPGNGAPAYYTADALYTNLADVLANGTNHGQGALTLSAAKWVYLVPGAGGSAGQRCHPDTPFSGSTYMFSAEEKGGLPWTNVGGYGTTLGEIQNFVWVDSVGADHGYRYSSHVTHYVIADGRGGSSSNWQPASDGDWASGTTFPALLNTANSNPALGDTSVDSPVNGNETSTGAGGERRGNYCSWNPLNILKPTGAAGLSTLSDGNLVAEGSNTDAVGTLGVSSGKWYFEVTRTSGGSNDTNGVGFVMANTSIEAMYRDGGLFQYNASSSSYGATWSVNNVVIGVALDLDNSSITFYKDGVSQGVAKSDLPAGTWMPLLLNRNTSTFVANFGQRSFSQTPPAGFSPLATSFLPEPTIKRGDEAATVALYTGNQAGQTVENLRISPDLVWIKNRSTNPSSGHYWHIHDTVRGKTGSFYNALYTNGSESENTYPGSSYGGLSDITDDGFTLSPAAGYSPAHLNANGTTYAAFCWDAGETTTAIAVGGLNSSAYNTSGWISNTTVSNLYHSHNISSVFDGSTGTHVHGSSSSTLHLQWSSGTIQGRVRLRLRNAGSPGDHQYKDAGGSPINISASTTSAWYDLGTVDLTDYYAPHPSGGNAALLEAIELDGKLLVDTSVTPPNVPSIATTVRARPETGFSIATYTGNSTGGATVAHGLNKKPDFFMIGCRNVTNGNYFDVWHSAYYVAGSANYMRMANNSTNGAKYAADMFQTPTAFVNTLGSSSSQNGNNNYVMYSWTAVEGYSSFGEFTGVGSEQTGDGPFVYCGFKPAVILWKSHSVDGSNWFFVDTFRHPDNVNDAVLRPNTNQAETDHDYIDVLSNGFKVRATSSFGGAGNGYKFLYAAWAENPFGSQTRAN